MWWHTLVIPVPRRQRQRESGVQGQSGLQTEKEAEEKSNKDTARSQPSANQSEASEEKYSTHTLLL